MGWESRRLLPSRDDVVPEEGAELPGVSFILGLLVTVMGLAICEGVEGRAVGNETLFLVRFVMVSSKGRKSTRKLYWMNRLGLG